MRKVTKMTVASLIAAMGLGLPAMATAATPQVGSATVPFTASRGTSNGQLTMVVGTDPTFPPFESTTNGKTTGFDISLITQIAKVEHIKLESVRTMQFTGLIPALQSDSIDVAVAGITIKKSRMKSVNFSNAYYLSGLSVLTKTSSDISGIQDLTNKVVAAKKGTTSVDYLQQHGVKDVKQYDTTSEMYQALESGGVDAVVFDNPPNAQFAKTHSNVHVVGKLLTGEYYGIAVSKKQPKLLRAINRGLRKVQRDGEYIRLFDQYFGKRAHGTVMTLKRPAKVATNS